jgi:hypothetical protein
LADDAESGLVRECVEQLRYACGVFRSSHAVNYINKC